MPSIHVRSPPLTRVVLCVVLCCASECDAANFLRSGRITETDAIASIDFELAEGPTSGPASVTDSVDAHESRLVTLQNALRPTYVSLPKDADGKLGHVAVRYLLHRLFVQRHGWYIKGLEPGSDFHHSTASGTSTAEEWVPTFLQERMEAILGPNRGAGLRDVAAFAAAIEDLVRKEAEGRLRTAYDMHGLSLTATLNNTKAKDVIGSLFVAYLVSGDFAADAEEEAHTKKEFFQSTYTGWGEAETWLNSVLAEENFDRQKSFDFAAMARLSSAIGEKYHRFNDLECRSLKSTMLEMEGAKPGRVRLSQFYKKALYSHWQFDEKADYLRALGALDESESSQAQVILPNYLMARTNCLEASNLYALCCQNECEALMGSLEQSLQASEASPSRIAGLVAELASDTVKASPTERRLLSSAVLSRLEEIAVANGGQVPIHGRLFAQWMHHAYPRECPYPHVAGAAAPVTADEWIAQSGHDSAHASKEEMLEQVESDTCSVDGAQTPGSPCNEDETSELPWSDSEELLNAARPILAIQTPPLPSDDASEDGPTVWDAPDEEPPHPAVQLPAARAVAALATIALLAVLALDAKAAGIARSRRGLLDGDATGAGLIAELALKVGPMRTASRQDVHLALLATAAYALNLLDGVVFLFAAAAVCACRAAAGAFASKDKFYS